MLVRNKTQQHTYEYLYEVCIKYRARGEMHYYSYNIVFLLYIFFLLFILIIIIRIAFYYAFLFLLQWYQCNLDELPKDIASKFVQLSFDEDTETFLKLSEEKSDWIFTQLWHSVLKTFLGFFMSQTSINGWVLLLPLLQDEQEFI